MPQKSRRSSRDTLRISFFASEFSVIVIGGASLLPLRLILIIKLTVAVEK